MPKWVSPPIPRSKRCDVEAGAWKLLVVGVSRELALTEAVTFGSKTPDAAPMLKPVRW